MAAKYKIGDLVQSKAGGPKLVVDTVHVPLAIGDDDKDPTYFCIWWVGNKRFREQFRQGGLIDWVEPASAKGP